MTKERAKRSTELDAAQFKRDLTEARSDIAALTEKLEAAVKARTESRAALDEALDTNE